MVIDKLYKRIVTPSGTSTMPDGWRIGVFNVFWIDEEVGRVLAVCIGRGSDVDLRRIPFIEEDAKHSTPIGYGRVAVDLTDRYNEIWSGLALIPHHDGMMCKDDVFAKVKTYGKYGDAVKSVINMAKCMDYYVGDIVKLPGPVTITKDLNVKMVADATAYLERLNRNDDITVDALVNGW